MTHFCSENRTGRDILNDNASGSKKIVGIKSVNYDLEIYFYKEGEPEEKWALLDPCYLNSILFDEDLFSIFPTVKISFGGQNTKDPIQFEGNSTDRVYIFLSKTIVDNLKPNENEPKIPYPIIDCEFVIWNMERTPNENVHAQNQTSVTTLTLIPFAQFKLLTTYPQWTTGFDAGSTFSRINITNPVFKEMSDMMNPGAGKPTGVCIKEILKKCDFDVDEGNDLFDDGIARINYTIPLRQSALDAISYILTYHLSKKNNDACVFKYNQFSKKFILPPFTKLFKNKIDDDEIKTYLTIPIRSEYLEDVNNTSILRITSPSVTNIEHSIETIGTESTQAVKTSRRKGTFVIDAQECDKKTYEKFIMDNYGDSMFADEQDLTTLIAPFQRTTTSVDMTPHYRQMERLGSSPQLINKIKTSNTFSFDIPGSGGTIQVGRRFQVRTSYGAAKENTKLKEMLGAYLITHTTHFICPRDQMYVVHVVGKSMFQSKDERFAFSFIDDEAQDLEQQNAKP